MKKLSLRRRATKRFVITVVLFFAVVMLTAVLGRSWVRHSALAWYGTRTAGQSVDKAFSDSFADFNQQLKANGVTLTKVYEVNLPCSTNAYHHLHVTVQCKKSRVLYANPSITDKVITNWPVIYQALTTHMTGGKAHVASISNVSSSALFTFVPRTTGLPENNLRLNGQQGKVRCYIDMLTSDVRIYASPTLPQYYSGKPQLLMTENCTRNINFFGGWDCDRDHNYCRSDNS